MRFLGLRTVIYPAPDLAAAKAWFSQALGSGPYFDEPFYVGYNVGATSSGSTRTPTPPPARSRTGGWRTPTWRSPSS